MPKSDIAARFAQVATLNQRYGTKQANPTGCADILLALGEFMESVRYLNTRRTTGAVLRLESEADVQDAVFLMLRPWIRDLVAESPTGKSGNRFTIPDFATHDRRTVIEVKYIRDRDHGRSISKELHDDIESFRHHVDGSNIVFFIFDRESLIPDQAALKRQIEVARTHDGSEMRCYLIVRP